MLKHRMLSTKSIKSCQVLSCVSKVPGFCRRCVGSRCVNLCQRYASLFKICPFCPKHVTPLLNVCQLSFCLRCVDSCFALCRFMLRLCQWSGVLVSVFENAFQLYQVVLSHMLQIIVRLHQFSLCRCLHRNMHRHMFAPKWCEDYKKELRCITLYRLVLE